MDVLRSKWFWVLAFSALFALSIDLWAWDWATVPFLGLPYTIAYFLVLEALLFILFLGFTKYYWTGEGGG